MRRWQSRRPQRAHERILSQGDRAMRAVRVRALIVALIVALYAAGGSGDLLARLLGNKLAGIWGQQVVVDNRPGAGGLIGTEFAARSEADGYTLYLATDGPLTI